MIRDAWRWFQRFGRAECLAFFLAASFLSPGCATLCRKGLVTAHDDMPAVYPATLLDLYFMFRSVTDVPQEPVAIIGPVFGLVDLPFSLAFDTVLLPWDIADVARPKDSMEPKLRMVFCPQCGFDNVFKSSQVYSASSLNCIFLYNEKGTRALIWSRYDPDYGKLVSNPICGLPTPEEQRRIEDSLNPDSTGGGRWLFSNPARCQKCGGPIAGPIGLTDVCLEYEGSLLAVPFSRPEGKLRNVMKE